MWAVEQLKAGKKVTSKKLNVPYLDLGFDGICNHKAMRYHTDIELFEATDWEVFEEKKTLSDKKTNVSMESDWQYQERDVKKALNELLSFIESQHINVSPVQALEYTKKVKEIFGERLIE